MLKNSHADFIGVKELIESHHLQLAKFACWADAGEWSSFHSNHYDWWAFPIDKPSSYGFAYAVFDEEIAQMKEDETFMSSHLASADLLLLSWGWNSEDGKSISKPESGQAWANWPIRLAKCARSMWLFGQEQQFESCVAYANYLKSIDTSFAYNGRDLFNEIVNPHNY